MITAKRYPHITSLYLNAGLGPYTGVNFLKIIQQFCRDGFYWFIANPQYMIEAKGVMSADGERGMTWGVNVLAPYIMVGQALPFHFVLESCTVQLTIVRLKN